MSRRQHLDLSAQSPRRPTIIALLIGLYLLCGCAAWRDSFDMPRIDLAGLEPMAGGDGPLSFLVKLRVVNPNTMDLNIKGLYYSISVEGHEVLSGASSAASRIPAYGEGIVKLTATPSLTGAIGFFSTLASEAKGKTTFDYELFTKLSLGGTLTPLRLRHEGTLDLKDQLRPFLPAQPPASPDA